ncbi:Leucine-rich repeat protein kinase family protein [Euphorbia peplus]|nr:Leucine-rich repeat protein kinase family protein [Euphorbia peplus]
MSPWNGITCGHKHWRVVSLKLPEQRLSRTISHFIGNLTFLRYLNQYNNTLRGDIPVNIGYCSELRVLSLGKNHLVGEIPAELGNLKKLITLNLERNSLTGKIPVAIGNLSSLQQFPVGENYSDED